jgi:hypothetical protein
VEVFLPASTRGGGNNKCTYNFDPKTKLQMAEKYWGYYRKGLLMCELHRTGSISGLLDYTNESSGSMTAS